MIDNTSPTTTASLSAAARDAARLEPHNVYFEQFTMGLTTHDDQSGYVVPEFRLDHDGWFNYFGWPDAPDGTPYLFTPSGTVIKNLTYGSLGTGGMSKAPFEQSYPDFKPGYGTHVVEHHAQDAAGNLGSAGSFKATVLPGAPASLPDHDHRREGRQPRGRHRHDVPRRRARDRRGRGPARRRAGRNQRRQDRRLGQVGGRGRAAADRRHRARLDRRVRDHRRHDDHRLQARRRADAGRQRRYVKLAGNRIYRRLDCGGAVDDFGAPNALGGPKTGTCAALTTTGVLVETPVPSTVGGSVPATLSLQLGPNASFGSFVAGVAGNYSAMTAANVISTAGNAALTVSTVSPGGSPRFARRHLTNGAFALPEALQVEIAPNAWSAPVSNGASTLTFRQHIGANDPLRTGTYSKTLTFTLSTTAP